MIVCTPHVLILSGRNISTDEQTGQHSIFFDSFQPIRCRCIAHQNRRRRFFERSEVVADMKMDDVRFIEAVIGVDRPGTIGEPRQYTALQRSGEGDRFEQITAGSILLEGRRIQRSIKDMGTIGIQILGFDDKHVGDHIIGRVCLALKRQGPDDNGLLLDDAFGGCVLHQCIDVSVAQPVETVFALDRVFERLQR